MEPLSSFVLFLSPFSHEIESTSLAPSVASPKRKKKNWLQKTLVHTQAIIRRSHQAALALADKATHQKDSEKSLRALWSISLLPSPFAAPNTPQGASSRVLTCHRTKWSVLVPASSTAKQCKDRLQQPTLTGHSFHCTALVSYLSSNSIQVYLVWLATG